LVWPLYERFFVRPRRTNVAAKAATHKTLDPLFAQNAKDGATEKAKADPSGFHPSTVKPTRAGDPVAPSG